MTTYGYARVSTTGQDPDGQLKFMNLIDQKDTADPTLSNMS
jgi:DNA invertase Pin-like site-specific DNA recombinase